jgi:hypothetical protein
MLRRQQACPARDHRHSWKALVQRDKRGGCLAEWTVASGENRDATERVSVPEQTLILAILAKRPAW